MTSPFPNFTWSLHKKKKGKREIKLGIEAPTLLFIFCITINNYHPSFNNFTILPYGICVIIVNAII